MSESSGKIKSNWNLAGHDWAVEMLRQHVSRGAVRHAYLITGPGGVGRRTLALRFAQALNCESPTPSGDPCGSCYHCKRLEVDLLRLMPPKDADPGNGHPDLRCIEPITRAEEKALLKDRYPDDAGDGGDDGTGPRLIRVGQVRLERERISLKPYAGRYRVLLFVGFETATPSAANALLKTLEEAPAHAVLILTANDSESLLPTIVSRCEVIRLHPVPLAEVQALLRQHGADANAARLIAHITGGSPGAALRLLADENMQARRKELLGELLSLLPGSRAQRFAYAGKLGRDRDSLRGVLLVWLSFWRDVLWRASGAASPIANVDYEREINGLARSMSLPAARHIVAELDAGLRKIDANVNTRLLAEVLLLDWPR